MSMKFSVYIGPYLIIPKHSNFDLTTWAAIVRDGRGGEGVHGEDWILIANCKPEGVTRQMQFDQYRDHKITQINAATIVAEMMSFSRLTHYLVQWCDDRDIEVHESWGIVPCWA